MPLRHLLGETAVTKWWLCLAAVALAAGLLPVAAGAQSAPEGAESGSESGESAVSSAVEALGGVVVLDGTVTFGSGVSGASGGTGFAGYSSGGGGIGTLEVSSVDGTVFGDASQVYALAQIAGAVDVGPAVGTTDAALLTVAASVDLSDGFWLVVGDHLLSSDGATVPVGELNSTGGLRYWLWNAPCKDWEPGDTAPVSIVSFGEDPAARWADTSLDGLGLTGATLDTAFDPATLSYTATAPTSSEQVTIDAAAPYACSIDISPADADAGAEGHQVDLGYLGSQTTVTVTVTAPDGDTAGQHTVQISHHIARTQTRSPAQVEALSIDAAPDLGFESAQTRHEATVPPGTASTQIDAVPVEGTEVDVWAITAGDEQSTPVDADGTVTLTPGADTVVAVRAATEHNESQRIYTVRLTTPNAEPPQQQPAPGTRSETRQLASRHTDTRTDTWRSSGARSVTGGWHNDRLGGWGDRTYRSSNNGNGNAVPRLSALTVDPGILDPAFAADTFHYDVAVTHDTEQITVAPTAAAGATAVIAPTDADSDTAGHQIALNAPVADTSAQTAVLITVTAGTQMDAYTLTVTRAAAPASARAFQREPDKDFTAADLFPTDFPQGHQGWGFHSRLDPVGMWSDGTDLWVVFGIEGRDWFAAYDLASKTLDPTRIFESGPLARPMDIWSDGETLWIADRTTSRLHGYSPTDGSEQPDLMPRKLYERPKPTGLWSDGDTVWLSHGERKSSSARRTWSWLGSYSSWNSDSLNVRAYVRGTTTRSPGHDISGVAGDKLAYASALWSDGVTMWILDSWDKQIYAYDLADGSRRTDLEFTAAALETAAISFPEGIWSDGATMWVSDVGTAQNCTWWPDGTRCPHDGEGPPSLNAFTMPASAALKTLEISGVDFGTFQTGVMGYEGTAAAGTTSATVTAAAAFADVATVSVAYTAADGTRGTGSTVTLSEGTNTVTVTSAMGTDDVRTYTVTITVPTS